MLLKHEAVAGEARKSVGEEHNRSEANDESGRCDGGATCSVALAVWWLMGSSVSILVRWTYVGNQCLGLESVFRLLLVCRFFAGRTGTGRLFGPSKADYAWAGLAKMGLSLCSDIAVRTGFEVRNA